MALGHAISFHSHLHPTLLVAERQPCFWTTMVETALQVGTYIRCQPPWHTEKIIDNACVRLEHLKLLEPYTEKVLRYPLTYCILVLPLTVVRWITWWVPPSQHEVPSAATFATDAVFGLSGFINAILLVTTRPESGLFGQLMFTPPAKPPSIVESEDQVDNGEMAGDDYMLGRLPSR